MKCTSFGEEWGWGWGWGWCNNRQELRRIVWGLMVNGRVKGKEEEEVAALQEEEEEEGSSILASFSFVVELVVVSTVTLKWNTIAFFFILLLFLSWLMSAPSQSWFVCYDSSSSFRASFLHFSLSSLSFSPFSISPFVPCGQAVLLAGWMAAPLKSKHSTREASLSPSFLCVQQPLLPPFFSHTFLCLFTSFHFIVSIKANLRGKNDEGEGRLLLSAMLCVIRQCERGNILSSGFYLYWQSLCRKQNLLLLLLVPPPLLNAFRNKVRVLYLERIQEKFFKLLIPLF